MFAFGGDMSVETTHMCVFIIYIFYTHTRTHTYTGVFIVLTSNGRL